MSNIFYANLPNCDKYEVIRHHAWYNFLDIARYLAQARASLREKIYVVGWEKVDYDDILDKSNHNKSLIKKNTKETWVHLVEPEDITIEDRIFNEFYGAKVVTEILVFIHYEMYQKEAQQGEIIKIIDSRPEQNLLLLENKPTSKYIGVQPNLFQINRQIDALTKLQSEPHPLHRPLIGLIEDIERVKWPSFKTEEISTWYFLKDDERPGTIEQREFVKKAIATTDFAILEGPPGSGKTTAICELIIQLINRGKKILLSASTHVAVDNVLEMLMTNQDVIAVRIGEKNKISSKVQPFQIENRQNTEREAIINFLNQKQSLRDSQAFLLRALKREDGIKVISNIILESANLVCGTIIGVLKHPEIKKENYKGNPIFDYLIIDEASKTTFQEFLVPAAYAKKWILVGDPRQLSPYVESSYIESNLSILMDPIDTKICRDLFYCKNYQLNLLVIENNEKIKEKYYEQAKYLGLNALNVTSDVLSDIKSKLEVFGSQIIIGDYECIKKIEFLLPMDFYFIHGNNDFDLFLRRNNHWLFHNTKNIDEDFEIKNWAYELAWRLSRSFELRRTPEEQEHFNKIILQLYPNFLPEGDKEIFIDKLNRIRRIAFPSIIELLKDGFERNRFQKRGTTLSDGFSEAALSDRYTLLTYQHRMHPQISEFPRKFIYNEEALKDPDYISEERNWSYTNYPRKSIWINIKGDDTNNQNLNEIREIKKELNQFLEWSKSNPPKNGDFWEVSILTFYLPQEKILKQELQKLFKIKSYQISNLKINNSQINICTVDRFQGHQADIVFLSFVKNRKIGFLDCINRLNVAITRAKYQLVMVGNKNFFENQNRSKILKNLARSTEKIITYERKGSNIQ